LGRVREDEAEDRATGAGCRACWRMHGDPACESGWKYLSWMSERGQNSIFRASSNQDVDCGCLDLSCLCCAGMPSDRGVGRWYSCTIFKARNSDTQSGVITSRSGTRNLPSVQFECRRCTLCNRDIRMIQDGSVFSLVRETQRRHQNI
jgi:hypothetical protein